jgi:hypothetical protein
LTRPAPAVTLEGMSTPPQDLAAVRAAASFEIGGVLEDLIAEAGQRR